MLNNKGAVVFNSGIWEGGAWTPLNGASFSYPEARAINDNGVVLGLGGDGGFIFWASKTANPSAVVSGDFHPEATLNCAYRGVPAGTLFNNGGFFIANTIEEDAEGEGTAIGREKWNISGVHLSTDDWAEGIMNNDTLHGMNLADQGRVRPFGWPEGTFSFAGVPFAVNVTSDNLRPGYATGVEVWLMKDYSWIESRSMKDVTDMSAEGVGITWDGKIWYNRIIAEVDELCGNFGEDGWSVEELIDINDHGAVLLRATKNGVSMPGGLWPVEVSVTDFSTKSDVVPYVATTNASFLQNLDLCLKADKTNETAKIEIELPSITDSTILSQMKWKVIKKPTDTLVSEGVFDGATPPSVDLSLGSGSSVEDEILFEVQVGADGNSFIPAAKMDVRVVRDRLNCWLEPFSSDFDWRTAKPEPRADVGDYPAHKAKPYKRESLQSVYEFIKSSTAIGPSTPKANWVKPSITCFGQFHDAIKAANGNNPLVDLNCLARIDMSAGIELPSFDLKYGALRSTLAKQTTYASDANPTFVATQFPERVQWAATAAAAVGDANLNRARLLALWTREGSMNVSSQHRCNGYNPWPLGFSAAVSAAPASDADAKTIFIYDVAYICLGSDFLLKHSGGADNQPDLRDYTAALAAFKSTADATGGAGIGDRIISNLIVAGSAGSYTVSANGAFYEDMLTLAGKHFVSVWQAEGPDATYMAYNMGMAKFNQMKATLGGASYPERGRLGLVDWAIHYEIRSGEWDQPRDFAQKFHAYRLAFEAKYP